MTTIWKSDLQVEDEQTLAIPKPCELLTVQVQSGIPRLWAIVDPSRPPEAVRILTYGTGHQMPATTGRMRYLGSYQLNGGQLVFHVFKP